MREMMIDKVCAGREEDASQPVVKVEIPKKPSLSG